MRLLEGKTKTPGRNRGSSARLTDWIRAAAQRVLNLRSTTTFCWAKLLPPRHASPGLNVWVCQTKLVLLAVDRETPPGSIGSVLSGSVVQP